MDSRASMSPEIKTEKNRRKGFVHRALLYFMRPFVSRLKTNYLKKKYAHHHDARAFDWDWAAINFDRIAVVNLLLRKFSAPAYLEIGCATNSLFNAVPALNKTGVDPSAGGNVRATSDEFFVTNEVFYDVVFIVYHVVVIIVYCAVEILVYCVVFGFGCVCIQFYIRSPTYNLAAFNYL